MISINPATKNRWPTSVLIYYYFLLGIAQIIRSIIMHNYAVYLTELKKVFERSIKKSRENTFSGVL